MTYWKGHNFAFQMMYQKGHNFAFHKQKRYNLYLLITPLLHFQHMNIFTRRDTFQRLSTCLLKIQLRVKLSPNWFLKIMTKT